MEWLAMLALALLCLWTIYRVNSCEKEIREQKKDFEFYWHILAWQSGKDEELYNKVWETIRKVRG